jgi:hypothetical protein
MRRDDLFYKRKVGIDWIMCKLGLKAEHTYIPGTILSTTDKIKDLKPNQFAIIVSKADTPNERIVIVNGFISTYSVDEIKTLFRFESVLPLFEYNFVSVSQLSQDFDAGVLDRYLQSYFELTKLRLYTNSRKE